MKTKLLLTFLFAMCMLSLHAQDIIFKKNGDEIKAKILDVSGTEIKYKKFENLDGPIYAIDKSEVFMIKYADGTKTVINNTDEPMHSARKKEPAYTNGIFQEGKSYASAGYGFGPFLAWGNGDYSYLDGFTSSLTGPFYLKYEYALTEEFGIGINLAYMEDKFSYQYEDGYYYNSVPVYYTERDTYSSFSGLLRANWHFGHSDKIDPYFGFGLGYRSVNIKYTTNDPLSAPRYNRYYYGYGIFGTSSGNASPFGFETTFGIKVNFTEHWGAYAETGFAKSVVQFGVAVKF